MAVPPLPGPRGPWLHVVAADHPAGGQVPSSWPLPAAWWSRATIRFLRASAMGSKSGILSEYSAALQFPSYFGMNWDALADCLSDLSWLTESNDNGKPILCVVRDAEELLHCNDRELQVWLSVITEVQIAEVDQAGPVHRQPKTLHTFLQTSTGQVQTVMGKLRVHGIDFDQL